MTKYRLLLLCTILCSVTMLHAQQADSIKVKVFFALDKYNIQPSAKATLDDFIKNHKEITWINIEAFTDSRASVAYNDKLAHNRAKSVQNYLVNNGLSKLTETHINAFGKRKLLDMGTSNAAHQNNRVVILTCYVVPPVMAKTAPPAPGPKPVETPKPVVQAPPPAPKEAEKPAPPAPEPKKEEVKAPPAVTPPAPEPAAPPIVTPPPAEPVKPAAPLRDTAIEVKEYVPTGEVDKGLEQRILEVIKHAKVGESFVLHTIYFVEGRHVFVKEAATPLNAVLQVMKSRPTLELEIQGHVCCTDSLMEDALDFDTHRFDLSLERAQAVAEYLAKNGIAKERVQLQAGFGSRKRLVYPEKSTADRNRNRRVEFKIVKK